MIFQGILSPADAECDSHVGMWVPASIDGLSSGAWSISALSVLGRIPDMWTFVTILF